MIFRNHFHIKIINYKATSNQGGKGSRGGRSCFLKEQSDIQQIFIMDKKLIIAELIAGQMSAPMRFSWHRLQTNFVDSRYTVIE